ncbi:MAG TPA: DUF4129 domain-containing protein [Anaerolineales bacterium]|nr:DUF4129 domain-containing protein [Anaerolineales bacterium]
MKPGSTVNARGNARAFRSLSYALVFLMMACAVLTMADLIQFALPAWHSGLIAGMTLLIVMDRLYTHQHLKSLTSFSSEWLIALAAQWTVILLFIRFLLSYVNGLDSFLRDLSLFARGDMARVFSTEFVVTVLLAVLAWNLTAQFLELLDEIGLDLELAFRENPAPIQSEAIPAHQRLVNLIFSMGIVLVILTALTRIHWRAIFSNLVGIPAVEMNRFSGGEAGTLLYFILGLALLSLSRLMALQTHWNRLRIPVLSRDLARQWGIYSLFLLLVLAVIVSLLPAGDSLGFFSVVGTLLSFLFVVLLIISQLMLALILFLFSLPFLLLGKAPPIAGSALPAFPVLPPAQPASTFTGSAVWDFIRAILLWGSLLAIVLFSVRQFIRQHGNLVAALRKSRIRNWLLLAWQWLYKNAEKTRGTLTRAVADGWQSIISRLDGKRLHPRPDWISLRSLDPRRRIYFYYLAMIRRGGEQGLSRKPSQTPSEYAHTLEEALPTASEDIDSITEAFIEARYSRQEVESRKAELVKATWGRIRHALQSKSKNK